MTDPQSILAIIPAFNEEKTIADIVRQTSAYLTVLVVDDGSRDSTFALAERSGAQVLRQVPNQGKGVALRAGFKWAMEHDYAACITLDADGQHDPHEIPAFFEALQSQNRSSPCDLIIGQRNYRHMPFTRRLANTLGRRIFSWAVGQDIPDNQSGYRLVSRRLMEACLESQETGFEFEVEQIVVCLKRGWRLGWLPIRTIYTGGASHIQPLPHLYGFIRTALRARKMLKTAQ
jgi:glycosyltransferase involved in cell wall biosynthesis